MPVNVLQEAFEAMQHANNSVELRVEMESFSKQMGFEKFAYALSIKAPSLKPQQYIISGYPNEWTDRYLARQYFKIDPLIRHAENSSLPAIWDEQRFCDDDVQEFWEEAREFGLNAGLTFAVHEQPGVTGIFSLSRDQAIDLQDQDLAALIGRAQMFASVLHNAVSRIDLPKLLPEGITSLTARERECLKWAADGKTAWETGQILGIAERTAVFHLDNVMQKLGAANKIQAIVRALALKLV